MTMVTVRHDALAHATVVRDASGVECVITDHDLHRLPRGTYDRAIRLAQRHGAAAADHALAVARMLADMKDTP